MTRFLCCGLLLSTFLLIFAFVPGQARTDNSLERDYVENSRRAAPRDAFPVLHNPDLSSKGKGNQFLQDSNWIIGIEHNGEARAYPVAVMGVHELVNDRVGGLPIAIGW